MRKLFAALVAFFCGSTANAEVEPLKILFIGNSYTHMNNMPVVFKKIAEKAGKDVIVERNTQSGASFKIHSEREDMYEAINSRKWDYVILQGYSRELSFPSSHIDSATVPYLNKITDSIYTNNPCTEVLFYMTWGYDNGFSEREATDSYEKMADTIRGGYTYLGEKYNVPVVPVGMVWREVRNNSRIDLYAKDRAHPSRNGSYLIALTFYDAIFNESLDDVYGGTIKQRHAKLIQKRLKNYMTENRQTYNLDKNRFEIECDATKDDKFLIQFSSNYSNATGIVVDYGDGTHDEDTFEATHYYDKPGKYVITVRVQDQCGERHFQKEVEFMSKKEARRRRREE